VSSATEHFDRIASRILAAHPAPDLRGITVILPNMHAAQPLAQALMCMAQVKVLLLPQMVTLNDWAQSVQLDPPITCDSRRSAMLYQQLRKLQWFEGVDLWGMTQELLGLFDELTCALHDLPQDEEAFTQAVQQACQARQNVTLQLEARLVFELWHAMQAGAELDGARAYQQRLGSLARQADRPLYVLRTSEWDVLEQRFLDAYAQRAPVKVFDLREMDAVLHAPRFHAATSLEQEARAAAMQVRLWLRSGKQQIAIVAQDRVVARRARALLERAGILVADESGWTFATLSVSTVLDRWLTALQDDFYHHDLLDLLKSPYIFADMQAGERKAVVYRLEQLLRKQGVVSGLEGYITLAAQDVPLHQPLARLRQAAASLGQGGKRTLAEWLSALQQSLNVLGIDAGLQQDEAGQQLLRVLQGRQQELQGDTGRYQFPEWRRWLSQQLDVETFRDGGIESTVRFTHLAATRWRKFDAVLLLGCDATHLPSAGDGGRWFNDAVRSSLGLPTRTFHAQRQHDDLHALLAMNEELLVTWQKEQDGEARLLSPFLQLVRDAQQGDDLMESELQACLATEEALWAQRVQSVQPTPIVPPGDVPKSISISAYNALVACPYQYYARHILKLNELDEVQETIEKRDYGERVHAILQHFHEQYPQVTGRDVAAMTVALQRISEEVFADLLAHDFAARAWLARWRQSLPAYLEWQVAHEAEGWRYAGSEQAFDWALEGVHLRGRIDRLDVRGDEKLVLDYKTQNDQLLRNKLREPGEDVQLACYACAQEAEDAAFISIEDGKVKAVAPQEDVPLLARLNAERLEQMMAGMRDGAGLPANGIDAVCAYCEVRGVCRKGEWS
jgi:ATP-dependent helicase/nuclease subunit B